MKELTFLQAWSAWSVGQLGPDQMLWGIHILWWARLGKIAQCLGALTVVVEIVGPERLRAFGQSLHGVVSPASIRENFVDSIALAKDSLVFLFTFGKTEQEARDRATSSRFAWLDALLTLPVGIAFAFEFAFAEQWWSRVLVGALAALISYVVLTPFLAALLVASASAAAFAVDVFLIEPIAWGLERPAIDRLAKSLGACLLVVGFHFDLLGS